MITETKAESNSPNNVRQCEDFTFHIKQETKNLNPKNNTT